MTGSALTRWELHCRVISLDKGRGLGRGWWPIAMGGRLVDDGKRLDALDVALR